VNAPRRRTTQRTHRHLDTGSSRHNDRVVDLREAFNDQPAGDKGGNLKIGWHGAVSVLENSATPPANFIEIESDPNAE